MAVLTDTRKFTVIECCQCSMTFAFPQSFESSRRDDHRTFYCPNGHQQGYLGPSDAEKLKIQLGVVERERDRWIEWEKKAIARVKVEQKAHAATKGKLTKANKRAAGGACPCCNRTFMQLTRHMKTQHPDFLESIS